MATPIESLLKVAEVIKKAGLKDEASIAAVLDASGLPSKIEDVQIVRRLATNLNIVDGTISASTTGQIASTVSGITGKVGSTLGDISKGVARTVVAHPVATAAVAGVTGVTIYGFLQSQQTIKQATTQQVTNPYGQNTIYTPAISQKATTTTTKETQEATTDYGLVGNFLKYFGTGLFGQTGEAVGSFIDSAKPWLIGGVAVVGIVAVAYAVKSLKGKEKKTYIIPETQYKVSRPRSV